MSTIGWLLVFGAALVFRAVSKGRSITDIPKDLGDAMTAILTNNTAGFKSVMNRSTNISIDTATGAPADTVSTTGQTPLSMQGGKHTQAQLITLGHQLQTRGFTVTEGPPPFGPIHSGHAVGTSYHYKKGEMGIVGMALDVNFGSGAKEKAALDPLANELVKAGWHVYWWTTGHYDHLHIDTAKGGRGTL